MACYSKAYTHVKKENTVIQLSFVLSWWFRSVCTLARALYGLVVTLCTAGFNRMHLCVSLCFSEQTAIISVNNVNPYWV